MASDIFAKLGDIKGELPDIKHKGEIEVLSTLGVSQIPAALTAVVAAAPAGRLSRIFRSFTKSTRPLRTC